MSYTLLSVHHALGLHKVMRILCMAIRKLCGFGRIKRPFAVPLMDLFSYLDFGGRIRLRFENDIHQLNRYVLAR